MADSNLFGLPAVTWLMVVAPFMIFWLLPLLLARIILGRRRETKID